MFPIIKGEIGGASGGKESIVIVQQFLKKMEEVFSCICIGGPEAIRIAIQKRNNGINSCQRVGSPEETRTSVRRINTSNNVGP